MSDPIDFLAIEDGCAHTMADAIPSATVFAAGATESVTDAAPLVVPLADDFSEVGGPFVTALIRQVVIATPPMQERLHITVEVGIWRERVDLPQNRALLWSDFAAAREAFIAHAKGYLAEPHVQSGVGTRATAPVTRALPAHAGTQRDFLYLGFEVEVVTNRVVAYQAG